MSKMGFGLWAVPQTCFAIGHDGGATVK